MSQRKTLIAMFVTNIILLAFVCMLYMQNHALRNQPRNEIGSFDSLDSLTEITVDFGGTVRNVEIESAVIFLMTSDCPYCKENVGSWNAIADQAGQMDLQIIGLLIRGTEDDYQAMYDADVRFPVLLNADKMFAQRHNISGVPLTLVVDHGRVVGRWSGGAEYDLVGEVVALINNLKGAP